MSKHTSQLAAISEKIQKLNDEYTRIREARKKEISDLAEKAGVLELPDNLIAGIFVELQTAFANKSEQLKMWGKQGDELIKGKRNSKTSQEPKS